MTEYDQLADFLGRGLGITEPDPNWIADEIVCSDWLADHDRAVVIEAHDEVAGSRLTLPAQLAAATIKECGACRGRHWCPRCSDRRDALARAIETLVATVSDLVTSRTNESGV